ncbi:MAG: ATP-binding region ATPase domain protein [Gemmatimonadetes bacterium]|nr:ATP-binding region ATPase domain protein [Gemmatimonadota bacterium]
MTEGAPSSTPLAPEWAARLSLAFVVFSLAALIAIPWATTHHLQPLRREMSELAEPGRGLVTQIHLAVAQQGATLDDYIHDHDPVFLARYRSAELAERAAYDKLTPLIDSLGASPRRSLDTLVALEARWHRAVEVYLRGDPAPATVEREREQEDLYDATLIAAAQLDQAITEAVRERRQKIDAGEALQQRVSALLGLLALAAAGATWWLGRRVRAYALEVEQRRAALVEATASTARFMRGVSHDLKNPLHAIDGHAQLLEDGHRGPLSAEQRDSVVRIRRSVRALMRLVEDLLELARAEAGRLTITPESVVLRDVVHETVEEHRAAAEAAGLTLVYDTNGSDVLLVTDAVRFAQVLGNLVSNAIKYTPSGGRIEISTETSARRAAEGGGMAVAIHVVDDGPGIPAEKHEEIFGEFTRLEPNDKPGAGLGLSIARRIARMLGGDVTVNGRGDRGSQFTLWLPMEPA